MEPTSGVPYASSTRFPPGEPMVEEEEEGESGAEVNEEAYHFELGEAGLQEEDSFQSVLMSAPQKKVYTQTQIAGKQHTNDFLNGERLSPKLPHHAQFQEEPLELELRLALLQLDMICATQAGLR
eukprot:2580163-Pleurochrysis_carterae.AAC.1